MTLRICFGDNLTGSSVTQDERGARFEHDSLAGASLRTGIPPKASEGEGLSAPIPFWRSPCLPSTDVTP